MEDKAKDKIKETAVVWVTELAEMVNCAFSEFRRDMTSCLYSLTDSAAELRKALDKTAWEVSYISDGNKQLKRIADALERMSPPPKNESV